MAKTVSHRESVHGVLWLDKPLGLSSNDALIRAKRSLAALKAGHGGTLDPMATGLLPLAFGEATKFLHDLLHADKTYEAVMQLGVVTSTGDAEGEVLATSPVPNTEQAMASQIEQVMQQFVGAIQQIPPMASALKHQGQPLYKLARAGIEIERAPRSIRIHWLKRIALEQSIAPSLNWPHVAFRVRVSKGTYIRTLAQDIGDRLGMGAHLVALRRLGVGEYESAGVPLLEIEERGARAAGEARALLGPVDALVQGLPRIELPESAAQRFCHGQRIGLFDLPMLTPSDHLLRTRVYRGERLLGTAWLDAERLAPERLVHLS